jgi:1-acyl-sn-glycerol-3-phosphate acyltransferase
MGAVMNRDVEFMAWGRLFTIPVLRRMIRFFGAFPVELSKVDKSAYVDAIRTLKKGKALIIFPEGKRSDDGEVKEFKSGFVRIAFMTNAMIVPVTIAGAYDAWPKHRWLPRPRRISVYYHTPISIEKQDFASNNDKHKFFDEVANQIRKTISNKLEEIKKSRVK